MQSSGLRFVLVLLGLTVSTPLVQAQESIALKPAEETASSQRRVQLRRVLNAGPASKSTANPLPAPIDVAQRHLSAQELAVLREQLRLQLGTTQSSGTRK
jgi:hypothetical protein